MFDYNLNQLSNSCIDPRNFCDMRQKVITWLRQYDSDLEAIRNSVADMVGTRVGGSLYSKDTAVKRMTVTQDSSVKSIA
jgi:hypothetical protein